MQFFTKEGQALDIDLGSFINSGQSGSVYKVAGSTDECIKIYNSSVKGVSDLILAIIRELKLKNYYEIYRLLYDKDGNFVSHTMKYYEEGQIDILTMPTEYTINSLANLYESAARLAERSIFTCDLHTGNVILTREGVIITDTDKFFEVSSWDRSKTRDENAAALRYLLKSIFIEALKKYHPDINTWEYHQTINSIFDLSNPQMLEQTCNRLSEYQYPIDYIRRRKR